MYTEAMKELWKTVPECTRYEVSSLGRLRRKCTGRILKGGMSRYKSFTPIDDHGRQRCLSVHKLVLTLFVGPCSRGQETRHLDGDPSNNRLDNLVWGTRSQNNGEDKIAHGRLSCGEARPNAKLTEDAVRFIRSSGLGVRPLARKLQVSRWAIRDVLDGKTWKHVY